ncbi:MAG: sulfur carrier protein ThiS adenylyltransferase ThiF [Desulfobacterales bacterium]|mgnify:CR=1 FL=1|nr:sulfur carrier protein ThiS adenylyltransferase ThiF [Desulfobacterales bacterium]
MNEFLKGIQKHFSPEDLEKIAGTKVGIAGAGGLGSNCAVHLVRSGFSRLSIADFDRIEASNLNRQFYFYDQLGHKKTDKLKENLLKINPDAMIETRDIRLDEKNILEVFSDCNIIVEALDRAEDKAVMVEAFIKSQKLFISVSGIGGWGDSDRIKTHKINDNFYMIGDMLSEVGEDMPPTSAIVSIAAAKQADIILSRVIGHMNYNKGHNES